MPGEVARVAESKLLLDAMLASPSLNAKPYLQAL